MAWLTRYRQFLRQKRTSQTLPQGPLTVAEVAAAKIDIVQQVQHEAFRSDILHLSQKEMKASQSLNRLDLVLVDGVIRVGGRLEKAPIDHASRHPIVLPLHHHVTGLIIRFYHQQEGHMGQEQVLAKMRQEFWVVHGRSAVRRQLSKCFECRRRNAQVGRQFTVFFKTRGHLLVWAPPRLASSGLAWPCLVMPCHALSCLAWVWMWRFFVKYEKWDSFGGVVLMRVSLYLQSD